MKQKVVNIVAICAVALLALGGIAAAVSCSHGQKNHKDIEKELSEFRSHLPMNVAGDEMVLTDVKLEDDIVVYTCEVSKDSWDAISLSVDALPSDRNIARLISSIDDSVIEKLIDSGLGLSYVYVSKENPSKVLFEVKADSKKLKEISEKLKSGEIQPMTLLELTELEIKRMKFPTQLEEGIWITNVYIDGKDICYEVKIESEIDPSAVDLAAMKEACAEGAREEPLLSIRKDEFKAERINIVYIYKDINDVEFARVKLSAEEIFQ